MLGLDPWTFRVRGKPMNRWTTLSPLLFDDNEIKFDMNINELPLKTTSNNKGFF